MTLYFSSFEEGNVGDAPPSPYAEHATVNPGRHATAIGATPVFKRRVCQFSLTSGTSSNNGVCVSFLPVDSDPNRGNCEFVFSTRKPTTMTGSARVHVVARGQGAAGADATDGYVVSVAWDLGVVRVFKRVAGSETNPFADLAIADAAGADWMNRVRVNGGATTTIQVRRWLAGAAEPATWDLTVSDSSSPITAAGFVGFGRNASVATTPSLEMNFFSVATNGDTAVVPLVEALYNAWLSSSSRRCFLAEMVGVGYDAGPAEKTAPNLYCISNIGYTSKAWDSPPSQNYRPLLARIPSFSRQMPVALSGVASTSFGSLVVQNPKQGQSRGDFLFGRINTGAGAQDDWLRVKWRRDYVKIWLGDESWPKHDFRLLLLGRLGQPTADGSRIIFPITDLMDKLRDAFQTNVFSTGNAATDNKPKPVFVGTCGGTSGSPTLVFGPGGYIDPVSIAPPFVFQVHDSGVRIYTVYDNYADLSQQNPALPPALTVSSISGNTITASAAHGLVVGDRVTFPTCGAGHAPDQNNSYYVISAGLTSTAFRMSTTPGGAEMAVTMTGSGQTIYRYAWYLDGTGLYTEIGNTGKLMLTRNPAGRVIVKLDTQNDGRADAFSPAGNISWAIFTKFGLSLNFKDKASFDAALALSSDASGVWFGPTPVTALDVLDRLSAGWNGWYGFTADGLLQIGRIDLPAATAALTLNESDVRGGSLRLASKQLPYDFGAGKSTVMYAPSFPTQGESQSSDSRFYMGQTTMDYGITVVGTVPLDYAGSGDTSSPKKFSIDLWYKPAALTESNRLKTMFDKALGIFEAQTRIKASRLSIGQTVALNHGRLGWKLWNAFDPSSPENSSSIDSTLAVVVGIDVDLSSDDPFPVRLTLMRQIPGYFPVPDASQFNYLLLEDGTNLLQEDGASLVRREYAYK